MSKKLAVTVLCIAVGVVMLFTTAFASMSGDSGYDTYKAAVKNTLLATSLTGNVDATVTDNGKELAKISSSIKADHSVGEKVSSSTRIETPEVTKTMDIYSLDGKTVMKAGDSDVYNLFEGTKHFKSRRLENEKPNPEALKAGEMIIDTLVGNLKNYFTLENKANGASEVNISLSDNQIPTIVNTLVSLGVKNAGMEKECDRIEGMPFGQDLKVNLPKLTEDIRIDSMGFTAAVNKNQELQGQTIHIVISGKDAEGLVHKLVLDMKISLSGLNTTIPDSIDLTGKNVKTIEANDFENFQD